MFHVSTNEGDIDGENEGQNDPVPRRDLGLQELLSNANVPISVYQKLEQSGMNDLQTLIFSDDKDLDELCKELQFKLMEKMKFKAAIRQIKLSQQPKEKQFIRITKDEQDVMDRISVCLEQANDIQQLFEKHFNQIDDHVADTKSKVNETMQNIIQSVQDRQTMLHQKIDEWKASKLESVHANISHITQYNNHLKTCMNQINTSLKNENLSMSEREARIKGIGDSDKYRQYQDLTSLKQYVDSNTGLMDVFFQKQISMNDLESFGEIRTSVNSNLFSIPIITLKEPQKIEETNNGCKVKLDWEMTTEAKQPEFVLKYVESDGEEKKLDLNEETWTKLEHGNIESEQDHTYSVKLTNNFESNKYYDFQVEAKITDPIRLLIKSNIVKFHFFGSMIDTANEVQIPLKIRACRRGHKSDHPPKLMLQPDDTYFLSMHDVTQNVNIIFDIDDVNGGNDIYYPTKLQIRGRGRTADKTKGDVNAVKRFRFQVGNSSNKEWMECNVKNFVVSKFNSGFQTFDLEIKNNDEIIAKKWQRIETEKWRQFKLQIVDTHSTYDGYSYSGRNILIQEFKLFGVKRCTK